MISFGPSSFDMPVEAAVPPGGADPTAPGAPGANPFDAVFDLLMDEAGAGTIGAGIDGENAGPDDGDESARDAATSSIDPAELVNPFAIAPLPVVLPVPAAPAIVLAQAGGEASMPLDAAGSAEGIGTLATDRNPSSERLSANELPTVDEVMPKDQTAATDAPIVPSLVEKNAAPPVTEQAPQNEAGANESVKPLDGQRAKSQAPPRSVKAERVRAESPRIEATPTRPFTVNAVDRAYTSGDGDKSSSSGSQRDLAAEPRLQAIGRPAAAVSFVVPAELPGLRSTPELAMTLSVEAPATIDQAAEMHLPQQIVQSIRLQAIDGGGEAVLRLRPEYLGEIVVAVKVQQGAVTAALQAETPAVRQWAERNEAVLRQALAEQGLQLEKLTVTDKATDAPLDRERDDQQSREEEPSRQQSRRRRQQPEDATFEVTV